MILPLNPDNSAPKCSVHGSTIQSSDSFGYQIRNPNCFECLPEHQPSCPTREYLEAQATWYQWCLSVDPKAFDLRNGIDSTDLTIELEKSASLFLDRFGDSVPKCKCGRLSPREPAPPPSQVCVLCGKNGHYVSRFSGRDTRLLLAPTLFQTEKAPALARLGQLVRLDLVAHPDCIIQKVKDGFEEN